MSLYYTYTLKRKTGADTKAQISNLSLSPTAAVPLSPTAAVSLALGGRSAIYFVCCPFAPTFFVFASCCLSPGTCVLKIGGSSSRRVVKFRNREIVQPFNAHRNGEIAERWYVTNRPTVNDGRQTNGKLLTGTVGPGCW